jgi:hypothetical protein
MPNTKISNLTSAGTLTGSEVAPIVQSGSTVKATAQNIANLAIPSQSGQNGKYLTTDGITTSWGAVSAGAKIFTSTFNITSGTLNQTSVFNNTGIPMALVIGPLSAEEISVNFFATPPNLDISWIFPTIIHNNIAYIGSQTFNSFFRVTFSYYSYTGVPANFTSNSTLGGQYYITGIFN